MAKTFEGPGQRTPVHDSVQDCPHCRRSYKLSILVKLLESEADELRNFTCLSKGCGGLITIGEAPEYRLTAIRTPSRRLERSSGRVPVLKLDGDGVPIPTTGADTVNLSADTDSNAKTKPRGDGIPFTRQHQIDGLKAKVRDSAARNVVFDGKYRTFEVVGEGSTGIVVAAEVADTKQIVALKFNVETVLDDDEGLIAKTRAERALRVQGMFGNRHVVVPLGSFQHPDFGLVTVEEYIRGVPLIQAIDAAVKDRESIIERHARMIARQLASVLADAYDRKVVHRDIKPHNVMLLFRANEPYVYLVDWGLARSRKPASGSPEDTMTETGARNKLDLVVRLGLKGGRRSLTESQSDDLTASLTGKNDVLGTPYYMAPEHIKGAEADHRSDLYSLGATLYHLVTGQPPFSGESPMAVMRHVLEDELPFAWVIAQQRGIALSKEFSGLLTKLLARDPDERFATAQQFIEALDALPEAKVHPKLGRQSSATAARRRSRFLRVLPILLLAGAIASIGISFWPQIVAKLTEFGR